MKMLYIQVVALFKLMVILVASSSKFDIKRDHVEVLLPHYALHPGKAMQLAMMEENLVITLRNISSLVHLHNVKKDDCESILGKYFTEFDEYYVGGLVKNQTGIIRASEIAENPNLLFKMIRRIFVTLLGHVYKSCEGEKWGFVRSTFEETFSTANLAPPTERDLDDALLGIIRIQYIYGLSAANIQRGIFQNVHTNATLNFNDCMAISHKALEMDAEVMAYQWLAAAAEILTSSRTSNESLSDTTYLEKGWGKLMNLTDMQTIGDLHLHFEGKTRQEEMANFLKYRLYATCRGETSPFHHKIYPRGLYCMYTNKWDYYFFINPIKVEFLSESPLVVQFYEVIGEKYRNFLREVTSSTMTRTETATQYEEESKYGDFITSISSLLQSTETEEQDELLNKLDREVTLLTGLAVGKKSRALQVSIYGALGGYYDFHLDTLQESVEDLTDEGDRIATALMPLKEVKLGGYTAFPKIGVFAKPIKGSLILWYNLWRNGKPDVRTLHGGCPVILGFKEVARRGIDQHMNIWNFPCHPNPML